MGSMIPIDADGSDLHIPFDEAAEAAEEILGQGQDTSVVFQAFECEHCGASVITMEANAFHENGLCSECRKTTDLRKSGCGFIIAVGDPDSIIQAAADKICGKPEGQPS